MSHSDVPTQEPTVLRAGDSWQWDITDSDHLPADGWSLTYYLIRGTTSITVSSTADGEVFEVRALPATTDDYAPGVYRLIGRLSKGSGASLERYTRYNDYVTVEPDPVNYTGSHAERMIVKIEAELEARAVSGERVVKSWQQGGRSEEYEDDATLQRKLGIYRDQVRRERGGPTFVPVNSTFRAP